MAFKLNEAGAKKLAENFHCSNNPVFSKDFFLKRIAYPLKELKSEVCYDGRKVVVTDPLKEQRFEIIDTNVGEYRPFRRDNEKTLCMHVKDANYYNGHEGVYSIRYALPEREFGEMTHEISLLENDELKLRLARELGKDLDKKAAIRANDNSEELIRNASIQKMSKELLDLFA